MVSGNMAMVRMGHKSHSECRVYVAYTGFDEGSPDGNDPLQIARVMASRGIVLVSADLHDM